MADKASIPGFIDVLAIFIKREQVKIKEVKNTGNKG